MASHAVADSHVLKSEEQKLYAELRRAKDKVRAIEMALTDIQRGIVHPPKDEKWIPPFLRRNYDDPTG